MEIDPNHPVTRAAHDQWHKICFLVLRKLGLSEVQISLPDVERAFSGPEMALVLIDENETVTLRIVPVREAELLTAGHGGLPS